MKNTKNNLDKIKQGCLLKLPYSVNDSIYFMHQNRPRWGTIDSIEIQMSTTNSKSSIGVTYKIQLYDSNRYKGSHVICSVEQLFLTKDLLIEHLRTL